MNTLAAETGGMALTVTSPYEMEQAATQLAGDVRSRREVEYTTGHTERDGKFRKLNVKVETAPGASKIRVNVQQGFYAPAN
jgi:hypothetical protein